MLNQKLMFLSGVAIAASLLVLSPDSAAARGGANFDRGFGAARVAAAYAGYDRCLFWNGFGWVNGCYQRYYSYGW